MFESSDEDDQRGAESSSRMWAEPEPEPGPSTCEPSRQGYCSYCRVLYRDLDQHLSSLQHLDSVHTSSRSSGSSVSISQSKHTLLERFLQDVLQHHPHRYNDPRPSHSDLPPVSAPLAPNREVSDEGGGGRTQAASEVTRRSANQERDDAHSCGRSEERLKEGAGRVGQQEVGSTQAPPPLHRKAHRKTDRRKSSVSSSDLTRRGPPHPPPDTGFDADSGPGPGPGRQPLEPRPSVSWQKQRQGTLKEQGDSVDQTIEQVIRTYCSGGGWTPFQKETTSLDLGAPVSLGTPSEDWDVVVQVQQAGGAQDLSQLMEARVDLQDQVYPLQLDLALRHEDPRDPASPTPLPPQEEEEVLPVSEDVPKSFRGKTWTQIRVEDEERVEKLVQQFREGKFVCYFDSESLARFGRRSRSRKGQGNLQAQQDSDPDPDPDPDPLPLLDHDGDSGSARRARRRRSFRLASRCQVVKVSQATQTFHVVAPVVHQLLSDPPQTTTPPPTQAAAAVERTPDMLRWRRLPSSYSTVITPLQPRTSLVYLLCSPPGPALHAAAAASPAGSVPKRCRKKRRPLDAQGLLKVKYKRFPMRLYDLSSNQILRNAPKGFVWYQGSAPSSPAPPCVRQLFRSLSTDLNTEGGQRSADSTTPFGSRCPLSALSKGAALSDKRSVLRRRGQASEAPPPPPPSEPQAPRAPKRRARTEAKPPALRRGTLRQSGAEPAPHQNVRGRTRRGRSCEKSQR